MFSIDLYAKDLYKREFSLQHIAELCLLSIALFGFLVGKVRFHTSRSRLTKIKGPLNNE